jgi:hypothetical protein
MKIHNMKEQVAMQKECFAKFVAWLEARESVLKVMEADREEEARGIDLWAVMKKADPVPIQVKVDSHIGRTGNIAVEVVGEGRYDSKHGPHKRGWLYLLNSTKRLVYIDFQAGSFKVYKSQEFYKFVELNMKNWPAHVVLNGSEDGGIYWHSVIVCMKQYTVKHLEVGYGSINSLQSGAISLV